jgi:glycosyltransferase involved in cell wall biosynthesis/SAM-dependent methyltransferase
VQPEPANFCTIIAQNYLAQARVLAMSVSRHHDLRLQVLVIDAEDSSEFSTEPFDVILPHELKVDAVEFRKMATIYEVTELATALKPWLLTLLLDRGAAAVVYLDPDIEIFSELHEVVSLAAEHGIVLIPHSLKPIPDDGYRPTPGDVSQSGVYNLGFIAVGQDSRPFLDWWSSRLRRDCVVAPEEGLFVDQRLMDFVPGYFPHHVHRDPSCNVAYWNLHERAVSWTGTQYEVSGAPLRFFHFSGYDPRRPEQLSKHQAPKPRTPLREHGDLYRLCTSYGERLLAAGFLTAIERPYGLGTSASGVPLDRRVRRLYRSSLIEFEHDSSALVPPDPLSTTDTVAFIDWLQEDIGPHARNVSRYLYALYKERVDLQAAFPDLRGPDAERYLNWVVIDGRADPPIPPVFLPDPLRVSYFGNNEPVSVQAEGLNVAGYVNAELGVGEAARLLIESVRAAAIPYSVVPHMTQWSRQKIEFDRWGNREPIYDVNLVCVNADQLPSFVETGGRRIWDGRYRIAYWWWEVDEFPAEMAAAADLVDEVWVGSAHAARAISRVIAKPVLVVPLPIVAPPQNAITRAELGVPEGFTFLFSFDFHSVFERKNPLGLIEAYRRAFLSEGEANVVIKTINGAAHPRELSRLQEAADGRSDIHVLDGYMSVERLHGLTHQVDAYVSLHRAEGHGLTLAEALAAGKPVIATGYSGNLEYMNSSNSYLVPYTLVNVPPGSGPYPASAHWAEPDLDAAAAMMRSVLEKPSEAQAKVRQALADIRQLHSVVSRGNLISQRLSLVRRQSRAVAKAPAVMATVAEVLPSSPARADVVAQLAAGPQVRSPSTLARMIQRPMLRLLRPLAIHYQETSIAILNALGEVEGRWWRQISDLERRLGASEQDMQQRTLDLQREIGRLDERLNEMASVNQRASDSASVPRGESVPATRDPDSATAQAEEDSQRAVEVPLQAGEYDPALSAARPDDGHVGSFPATFSVDSSTGRFGFAQNGERRSPLIDVAPRKRLRKAGDPRRVYIESLRRVQPVLVVGCGRGEFLRLLRDSGVEALGIERDQEAVAYCARDGLQVQHFEPFSYLDRVPDCSIGAIFSAETTQEWSWPDPSRFIALSLDKLKPGGLFVAEVASAPSRRGAAQSSRVRTEWPIPPESLLAACCFGGFSEAEIVFPAGTGSFAHDRREQSEFAVVARKPLVKAHVTPEH